MFAVRLDGATDVQRRRMSNSIELLCISMHAKRRIDSLIMLLYGQRLYSSQQSPVPGVLPVKHTLPLAPAAELSKESGIDKTEIVSC